MTAHGLDAVLIAVAAVCFGAIAFLGALDVDPVLGPPSNEVHVAGDDTESEPASAAAPEAGFDPGEGDYPNMPSGLTVLGHFDGSAGGTGELHAFGIAGFGKLETANGEVTVVDDPTNPTGSGTSLRFRWAPGGYPSGAGKATMYSFPGGPVDELYVMMRVYMEPGGWDFGHKFFYIGTPDVDNPPNAGFYVDRPGGGNPQKLRVIYDNSLVVVDTHRAALWQGEWLDVEFHLVGGHGNGQARVWINGDLVAQRGAIHWTDQFDGMQWYALANRVNSESAYRIGELVIAGRR